MVKKFQNQNKISTCNGIQELLDYIITICVLYEIFTPILLIGFAYIQENEVVLFLFLEWLVFFCLHHLCKWLSNIEVLIDLNNIFRRILNLFFRNMIAIFKRIRFKNF